VTGPKPPSPQGISTRYHYVITLQFEKQYGQHVVWESGVMDVGPGDTRADLYRAIFRLAAAKSSGVNPVPLFFSLEPDELIVTSPKTEDRQ
jgi:hypothetical protein